MVNGYDIPYKLQDGNVITIRPIKVKDWAVFDASTSILQLDKNSINDIEVISMSYLKFLIEKVIRPEEAYDESDRISSSYLYNVMSLSTGYGAFTYGYESNKPYLLVCDEDDTILYKISQKDFDDISSLILNYNYVEYDDRYVDPDVKELMQEYYKAKYNNSTSPSLEKRKAYVVSKTGYRWDEINEMSYREFSLIYSALVEAEEYMARKIVQASQKYDVKEDVVNPLYEKKKDPYSAIFEDTSVLAGKGISGADKLSAIDVN